MQQQQRQQKRTALSPLEFLASGLCLLYGIGFFFVAHTLDGMGLLPTYVQQVQAVGVGLFLVALVGLLRIRVLTQYLQVFLALAWFGLIPTAHQLDQDMGNEGLGWFTPWAIAISLSLCALHLFFAWQLRQRDE